MKKLLLIILCGIALNLNFAVADSLEKLLNTNDTNKTNNTDDINDKNIIDSQDILLILKEISQDINLQEDEDLQKEILKKIEADENLQKRILKEIEKYDKNIYNTPKTEQDEIEFVRLEEAITNGDYNKTKEILDSNPNLINLNYGFLTTPISLYFSSIRNFNDKKVSQNERFAKNLSKLKDRVFDEKMFELLMSYKPKLYTNFLTPFLVIGSKSIDDNKTTEIIQMMLDEGMNANLTFFTLPNQLVEEAFEADKFNTTELLLKHNKDERICLSLQMSSGFKVGMFFVDKNASLFENKSEPLSEKQIGLTNSPEFLSLKNRQLDFVEKIIKNYCDKDLSGLVSYEMILKRLGDNENMERLRKLGYKDTRDSSGKNILK